MNQPQRLRSFDLLRAIAMTLMILAHSLENWISQDSKWYEAICYYILSPMGIPGFVFVSGLGFGFSWSLKAQKGLSIKELRYYAFARTVVLLCVAYGYNLAGVIIHGGWYNIWFWYILQSLAISRLISLITMAWKPKYQYFIAGLIFFGTPYYLQWLNNGRESSDLLQIIYFLSFNRIDTDSIFFFYPFFIIGQNIGKKIQFYLSEIDEQKKEPIEIFKPFFKNLLIIATIFIILALIVNKPVNEDYMPVWTLLPELRTHPAFSNVQTIPMILVKNTLSWNLYSAGITIYFLVILFYRVDLLKKAGWGTRQYELIGKYSLTIYLLHYIFYISEPYVKVNWIWLNVLFLLFFIILWAIVYSIDKYTKGKYSIEYLVVLGARSLMKKKNKKNKKNEKKRILLTIKKKE